MRSADSLQAATASPRHCSLPVPREGVRGQGKHRHIMAQPQSQPSCSAAHRHTLGFLSHPGSLLPQQCHAGQLLPHAGLCSSAQALPWFHHAASTGQDKEDELKGNLCNKRPFPKPTQIPVFCHFVKFYLQIALLSQLFLMALNSNIVPSERGGSTCPSSLLSAAHCPPTPLAFVILTAVTSCCGCYFKAALQRGSCDPANSFLPPALLLKQRNAPLHSLLQGFLLFL